MQIKPIFETWTSSKFIEYRIGLHTKKVFAYYKNSPLRLIGNKREYKKFGTYDKRKKHFFIEYINFSHTSLVSSSNWRCIGFSFLSINISRFKTSYSTNVDVFIKIKKKNK